MTSDGTIEIIRPAGPAARLRAALFDFDGTLSLLREGWPAVMTELMLAELRRTPSVESDEQLTAVVEEIVVGMNGRPTIVQMQALVAEVKRRGGRSADPTEYTADYQERLLGLIRGRYDDIESSRVEASVWAVPGTHAWLDELRRRGLLLVLISGSEFRHVQHEADLLGLTEYFGDAIFAPADNDPTFNKRAVIKHLLNDHNMRGNELVGFGDGVVETEEVRRIGGLAVAVACEEPPQRGVNAAKRDRLIRAGADVVIADYQCQAQMLRRLFAEG
jgi:phosphoglycolate phosphatase-like HAD superfamily hydrolase